MNVIDRIHEILAHEDVREDVFESSGVPTLGFEDLPEPVSGNVRTLCVLYDLRNEGGVTASQVSRETQRPEQHERVCLTTLCVAGLARELSEQQQQLYAITSSGIDIVEADKARGGPLL